MRGTDNSVMSSEKEKMEEDKGEFVCGIVGVMLRILKD